MHYDWPGKTHLLKVAEAALIPRVSLDDKLAVRSIFFVLRLLVDTSAWLDLAGRRDGQKWIVPLRVFLHQGKLELLVPPLVIEEFEHNRPPSEAVTKSVLARLRQLRRELDEFAGKKHEHVWLEGNRAAHPAGERDGSTEFPGNR
jgi:hypothetical protein